MKKLTFLGILMKFAGDCGTGVIDQDVNFIKFLFQLVAQFCAASLSGYVGTDILGLAGTKRVQSLAGFGEDLYSGRKQRRRKCSYDPARVS